ncbi:polyamine deacetylase HDAC10-like isoform X1 [Erythrolamprus reginae]|uniref:polyamine deacetylase HDAC10-like isoform X1 n=3 Tax=Erythrolamprus reginae TaxID=121349 RepID=UPI00396CAA79
MAAGTALVYDGEMTNHKLLWEDPNCNLEVPERLSSCYDRLQHYNLIERCISVSAREGTESEIMLIHSMDYVEIVKSTEKMEKEELQKVSADYDAVYFHPTTYHCAKLAVGATLQLVDAVMSGKARNGLTLIRPPGHHSQRSEANGFCIFNNVAIAAKYAQRNYGLQRILIVDWDIHHGQGIQYAFDDDPSVLYFSWHRFEHQNFWPWLRESNYDAVGQGKGRGFNINVPWNQVGMGNSDYLAAFLHVLLPIAFEFDPELVLISAGYDSGIGDPEGQMKATPECFSHLTHFLMNLAHGKLCAVLEGGYHLQSLSESVCMTLKALLGDPLPPLSGEMMPCLSARESIENVRTAHKPYWKCLTYEGVTPVQDLGIIPCGAEKAELTQTNVELQSLEEVGKGDVNEVIKTDRFLETHMKSILSLKPSIRTAAAVDECGAHLLPPTVHIPKGLDGKEFKTTLSAFDVKNMKEEALNSLLNMLAVLNKIIKKEVINGLAVSSTPSLSSAIAIAHCRNWKVPKVLCVFVGDMDMKIELDDDKVLLINICRKRSEQVNTKHNVSLNWKEDPKTNNFFSATFGFILPVAYSYQPNLTIVIIGPNQNLGKNRISLLISLLQGLAECQILAVIQDTEEKIMQDIANILTGDFIPTFGNFAPDLQENVEGMKELRAQFQQEWKLLQCSCSGNQSEMNENKK